MGERGKNILLGITGSIAAYKSAFLIRLLVKNGYNVKAIMTKTATGFISPLTISTLSKNKVFVELWENDEWNNHIDLGLWADIFVIAPATANSIAKMNTGIADNLLLTTYLSARCPVVIAPAMDLDMWHHVTTQKNLKQLQNQGVDIIPVENGELASGLSGEGRMAEPENIFGFIESKLNRVKDLEGKSVLITAGPTYESLDPVRFIGNRSTGKMGIALAKEALARGAKVTLVLGPSREKVPAGIDVVKVESAADMANAVFDRMEEQDIMIMAAAVADYTPETVAKNKIKKKDDALVLKLKRTTDIAATVGKVKKDGQILVGFALETDSELENAKSKLKKKNFDFIVQNSIREKGAGFAYDTNKITIIGAKDNKMMNFELKSKDKVAADIWNEVVKLIKK